MGWIRSRRTQKNVGAIGNTLEDLLGIKENNLPIANAGAWEVKAQRRETESLTTLFHFEPWPRKARIVPKILLPKYGWPHETEVGEMSFRGTMSGSRYTDRGFKVIVDKSQREVRIDFDSTKVDARHADWLKQVRKNAGLGNINPQPYWTFDALQNKTQKKLPNSFYLEADTRKVKGKEEFRYETLLMLQHFNFGQFLGAIDKGTVLVDFDAKTTHNHGTKFRMKRDMWSEFYGTADRIF